MKPMMPPPVPYCVAFELRVVKSSAIGAAEQRAARQSWRKRENMVVGWLLAWLFGVELSVLVSRMCVAGCLYYVVQVGV